MNDRIMEVEEVIDETGYETTIADGIGETVVDPLNLPFPIGSLFEDLLSGSANHRNFSDEDKEDPSTYALIDPNLSPAADDAEWDDDIWELTRPYLPQSRKRPHSIRFAVACLVANLVIMTDRKQPALVVPRNKRFFDGGSRYRSRKITFHSVTGALDAMRAAGLIDQRIGKGKHAVIQDVFGEPRHIRKATLVRPLGRLQSFIMNAAEEGILFGVQEDAEVIHLRDKTEGDSHLVAYDDTPETVQMRDEVRRINVHLERHPCTYAGRADTRHPAECRLIRIFNNGVWSQGGRLFGYWPMSLSKTDRCALRIDGEPLADLDYASCFIGLLHAHDGTSFDCNQDPFRLPGLEQHRACVKQCVYSILNAPRRLKNFPRGISGEGKLDLKWKQVEQLVFKKVPLCEKYAYSGIGLELMRRESDILIAVLHELIERDIGFVPMHDGIMVPESKADVTRQLMLDVFRKFTGQEVFVKKTMLRQAVNLVIKPAGNGNYKAFYQEKMLCCSRTPTVSAARKLKALGFDDATIITTTHEGSDIVALTTKVGLAARLRVYEPDDGPIRLRKYRSYKREGEISFAS